VYVKCGHCEDWHAIEIPQPEAQQKLSELTDEEEAFVRYLQRRADLTNDVDDLMTIAQEIQSLLYDGQDVLEEFSRFESTLERLVETQTYIDEGDEGEEADEEDLWRPLSDGDRKWDEFDRYHGIEVRKCQDDYADVTITDAGGDLLEGEQLYHFGNRYSDSRFDGEVGQIPANCHKCDNPIDVDGYCTGCYMCYADVTD
jgi:hypothetical protein